MEPHPLQNDAPKGITDDLLRGVDKIAHFIFGKNGGRCKICYLADTSHLAVCRLGAVPCARQSVLLQGYRGRRVEYAHH